MNQVTVSRTISMGHRLPSYKGICSSLHGHNVRFQAEVTSAGFLDFKAVDNWLGHLLSDLDHAMVLSRTDPVVSLYQGGSDNLSRMRHVVLSVEPTTEALAQLILNELSTYCHVIRVTVFETDKYSATATEVQSESDPLCVFRVTR